MPLYALALSLCKGKSLSHALRVFAEEKDEVIEDKSLGGEQVLNEEDKLLIFMTGNKTRYRTTHRWTAEFKLSRAEYLKLECSLLS